MKKLFVMAFTAILFASCSSNEKEVEVCEPTYNTFENDAELKKVTEDVITVVPGTAKLTWKKYNGLVNTCHLTIKLRKNAEIDAEKYNVEDYDPSYWVALADNNGQFITFSGERTDDISGPSVSKMNIGVNIGDDATEKAKIKELLAAEVGAEADVSFVLGGGNDTMEEAVKNDAASAYLTIIGSIRKK
ncbi:MAG: hypothetical protein J5630_03625 [Bacteroidaceae bacterium]|nr:hypothetical protein [Bacteroidaceae bacterium]